MTIKVSWPLETSCGTRAQGQTFLDKRKQTQALHLWTLRCPSSWHPFFRSQWNRHNRGHGPFTGLPQQVRARALETESTLRGQLLNPGLSTASALFSPKNYWAILLLSFTTLPTRFEPQCLSNWCTSASFLEKRTSLWKGSIHNGGRFPETSHRHCPCSNPADGTKNPACSTAWSSPPRSS